MFKGCTPVPYSILNFIAAHLTFPCFELLVYHHVKRRLITVILLGFLSRSCDFAAADSLQFSHNHMKTTGILPPQSSASNRCLEIHHASKHFHSSPSPVFPLSPHSSHIPMFLTHTPLSPHPHCITFSAS